MNKNRYSLLGEQLKITGFDYDINKEVTIDTDLYIIKGKAYCQNYTISGCFTISGLFVFFNSDRCYIYLRDFDKLEYKGTIEKSSTKLNDTTYYIYKIITSEGFNNYNSNKNKILKLTAFIKGERIPEAHYKYENNSYLITVNNHSVIVDAKGQVHHITITLDDGRLMIVQNENGKYSFLNNNFNYLLKDKHKLDVVYLFYPRIAENINQAAMLEINKDHTNLYDLKGRFICTINVNEDFNIEYIDYRQKALIVIGTYHKLKKVKLTPKADKIVIDNLKHSQE